MAERKPKRPTARETAGEGAPPRSRKGSPTAEDVAEPKRDEEGADGRLIDRRGDARIREGL
jgi:hypothetical protein